MKKLVVIDGNSLANRAFYAIPMLSNSKGIITNAVYGFTNMLQKLIQQEQPDYLAVAFDVSRKVFRHEQYADYKAQRKGMPDELRDQMGLIKDVLHAMNIPIFEQEGYEGDDIIGTMVKWAEQQDIESIIVTGDKDSLQLISDKTSVHLTKKGITELGMYDYATFHEEYNLVPDQIRDLKGLMGDSSDNIPGVPGVGEKTAMKLLHDYGTIEELYQHLDDFKGKKLGDKLRENEAMAHLSKELATIYCQVPLELSEEALRRHPFNRPALVQLYKDLELRSLLKDLDKIAPEEPGGYITEMEMPADIDTVFSNVISDLMHEESVEVDAMEGAAVFAELDAKGAAETSDDAMDLPVQVKKGYVLKNVAELKDAVAMHMEYPVKTIIMIAETTPGNILDMQVNRLGLFVADQPYIINCKDEPGEDFAACAEVLRPWMEADDILVMTDDAKKLYSCFRAVGVQSKMILWDSALIAYLLNPERKELTTEALLAEQYDLVLPDEPDAHLFGLLKGIFVLSEPLVDRLDEEGMLELYAKIELPLSALLPELEYEGVRINTAYLEEMGAELTARIDALTQKLYQAAGETFNLNSSKQLGVILFEKMGLPVIKKTKTGYSTDAEVLDTLAEEYDFVRDILEYRQLTKLKSTYVDGILKLVRPDTGKVHTTFNQTITATGRLSSTEPNLQNIPIKTEEGKRIRKAFVPSHPEYVLVAADYSQIELRVLAHMSQDPVLMDSFKNNEDIHRRTASEVFGVPMEEVTKDMRRNAKAVNFGIIYGQTEFGLSKELGISRSQAKEYINSYFERYSGVKQWIDATVQDTRLTGVSRTLMGRKRYIKDINSKNFNLRSFAERTAVNSPIQGTAADIIKLAMLKVQENLKAHNMKTKMLLQVHDELIFEVPPAEIAGLIVILHECMEHAVTLDVPLKIDVNVGFDWYDMQRV
ncbi:MAG: DNA polymerase I [Peptococcaceae bacterium]|nr:DNA polymerase I [Peptococcaceae bacterium]